MNIALYGFMGVGKTTVGQLLAERLDYAFVDMDSVIEERTGTTITDIFAQKGEDEFRRIEKQVAREVSSRDRLVVGCGGGVVMDPENVEALRTSSKLVLLEASVEEILNRISEDESRPLVNVSNKEKQVKALLQKRRPTYRSIADLMVVTDHLSPNQVAEKILEAFEAEK